MSLSENGDQLELDDLGYTFLEDLRPFSKLFKIRNESQFQDIVQRTSQAYASNTDETPCEYILFSSNDNTISHIIHSTHPYTMRRLSAFDLNAGLLLAKLPPTIAHSTAATEFQSMLHDALQPMGLHRAIKGYASAGISGDEEKRAKQPDGGWGPKRRPPRSNDRPSVVLEVALSEPDKKLQSDIRFWLSPGDGDANVCFTVRLDRSRSVIRIENWHRAQGRIRRNQRIWIQRVSGQIQVTGDSPLSLSFEDLFRRKPDRPGEHDLELSSEALKEYARTIWDDYDC
ncbi:hypothetical protein VI817_009796 [Penicillium citrinum]|uniref:Uncharacterized protein n=1 Tax=Penicillium hetheringtonii TaxID=911720 RepID=A0AAD6GPZ8_9EURO|nr:hypothetical protein N7450_006825 [Penicillium hetheringtonii]KAK5788838.1 hypothetical protein VI817_009796 [Penicillium citrinum]